jgi:hypothetical protein
VPPDPARNEKFQKAERAALQKSIDTVKGLVETMARLAP